MASHLIPCHGVHGCSFLLSVALVHPLRKDTTSSYPGSRLQNLLLGFSLLCKSFGCAGNSVSSSLVPMASCFGVSSLVQHLSCRSTYLPIESHYDVTFLINKPRSWSKEGKLLILVTWLLCFKVPIFLSRGKDGRLHYLSCNFNYLSLTWAYIQGLQRNFLLARDMINHHSNCIVIWVYAKMGS